MVEITAQGVYKSYEQESGHRLDVLDDISLDIVDGEFLSILGPSGCGKSTFLRIIAGMTPPTSGDISMDTADPRVGFVFQDPTLLDWRTVENNVKFALRGMGVPQVEHDERIRDVLETVGLYEYRSQYPPSLSGGMRQRVGLARALSIDPDILLMDEPFGSLDELTARKLRDDLLGIWRDDNTTILFVTHDITEAIYLADRVAVFSEKPAQIDDIVEPEIPRPREPGDPRIMEYEEDILSTLGLV